MPTEPPLILLIEEDPILADIVSMRLELLGYRVQRVAEGSQAMEAAERSSPQLILLDLASKDHTDLDLLNELSSEPTTSQVPLLLFSDSADLNDVEQAFAAGAKEYVVKPYDPVVLERKIDQLLTESA